jgi:pimeloyl-ACP methyl ester carboxylesterase
MPEVFFPLLLRWFGLLLASYTGFVLFLFLFQERLIFFPPKMTEERWKEVAEELHGDYVTIRVNEEGVHLQGWFLGEEESEEGKIGTEGLVGRPTVLFFGGNAMRLDLFASMLEPLRNAGVNIFLIDYRGYGLSEGKPSAEAMKTDAVKVFDAVTTHPAVDPERIFAWGYSIGSAVATHLAAQRPVAKLILFAPFTSSVDVAKRSFPFLPRALITLLLRHHFETLALAPSLHQPVLIVHGDRDWQAPLEGARRVAAAWQGPVKLVVTEGRSHNDLLEDEGVWEAVLEFVK